MAAQASQQEEFAIKLQKDSDAYKEVVFHLKMGLQGHPCSDIHVWAVGKLLVTLVSWIWPALLHPRQPTGIPPLSPLSV
jgi:hypothetical protein